MTIPQKRIYLDYNATSPVHPEVLGAVSAALSAPGNASSVHYHGRSAKALIEDSRDSIGELIGASSGAITFLSGATESNATVIMGLRNAGKITNVLCSAIEHPSVLEYVRPECRIRVSSDGVLDLNALDDALREQNAPFLVCIMLANNETGVVQPVKEVAALVHAKGGLVLCDAVQGPGKMLLNVATLGADFFSFSAHKIGGPQGVGCLVISETNSLEPILLGGGQERRMRAGAENVSGIAGYAAASKVTSTQFNIEQISHLRDRLEQALLEARPDAIIFGSNSARLPNTTNVAIRSISSEQQVMKLDLAGFSVSAGSACSSGKVSASHVLLAMGITPDVAGSAIRISIGSSTTWAELEQFLDVWVSL
jgi:cysteine desulfurase